MVSPPSGPKRGISWSNADPFRGDRTNSSAGQSQHDSEKDIEKDGHDTQDEDNHAQPQIRDFAKPKNSGGDRSEKQGDGVLGTLRSAVEDVGEGVIDRVKSAEHNLQVESFKATGPSKWFNPTNVRMRVKVTKSNTDGSSGDHDQGELDVLWRSRDNRKGRQSIAVPLTPMLSPMPQFDRSHMTSSWKGIWRTLKKMFTTFPYWDISFWGGWSYTIGSLLFVIDGLFSVLPIAYPDTTFPGEELYGVPLCFLFGALFYQIGAVTAYFEAINDGSFHGSAMRRILEGHEDEQKKIFDAKMHHFFSHFVPHRNHKADDDLEAAHNRVDPYAGWETLHRRSLRPGSIYPRGKMPTPRRGGVDLGDFGENDSGASLRWQWYPTWEALRTHHLREIGYLATTIQLVGVTMYGVTAIVLFPYTLGHLTFGEALGAYWILQIVASMCFLIASIMFMLETQEKWWKPELRVLGWWVGAWSVVGSVGFELCGIFGTIALYTGQSYATYQGDLSSTWGSAAYLVGSFLQWYEALSKNPIEELLTEPGELKSWQVHPL